MSGNANPVRSLWPQFFCQVYTILLYIPVYAHRQCSLWLCWKKLLSVVVSGESRVVRCLWGGASLTSSHLHHSPGLTTAASCSGFSGSSGRTPNNQDLSETAEKDSMNLPPSLFHLSCLQNQYQGNYTAWFYCQFRIKSVLPGLQQQQLLYVESCGKLTHLFAFTEKTMPLGFSLLKIIPVPVQNRRPLPNGTTLSSKLSLFASTWKLQS